MNSLQKKSHEVLLRLLNNIGVIGAILAAIADIIFVVIMVVGVDIQADLKSVLIFAIINALIGILINVLLRYQGQKYAEIENEELCKAFYNKRAKEKKYMSMGMWMTLKTVQDFVIKGGTTAFSVFGVIYITIQGSKDPIQLLITLATLVLFACFGLIGMNSAYGRFYNVQIPYMRTELEKRNEQNKVITRAESEPVREVTKQNIQHIEVNQKNSINEGNDIISVNSGTDILEPCNNNGNTGNIQPTVVDNINDNNTVLVSAGSNAGNTATNSVSVELKENINDNKEKTECLE